ncbi:beta-lactamase [Methanocaldococcus villosus KIN24-T80]|uniref:Beta-lactamase n=1 Tax=Methanocaldococcus villosus KIN24-T80 TaxID=1069083 RepID=N6V1N4_9EURY|nr:FprA family A-type flavoprotein [Methanocaldococcus villosus]ENN96198.1 beta-lactamase [Methanocaldococcus villosus KIN24-T80]
MAIKVKDGIYWLGTVDWESRDFHGYPVSSGTSYNSYLIVDEKKVLIDTTECHLYNELMKNLSTIIDPKDLDYIVLNHTEKDHSEALPKIVEKTNATIITNANAKEYLSLYYNTEGWDFIIVEDGDEIEIGKRTLTFIKTPMLHWPDNMMVYTDNTLFSNDAFGQHIATNKIFDYQYGKKALNAAKEYFATILMPYRKLIPNAIEKIKDLEIDYICPSHGVIWKEYKEDIIKSYLDWSNDKVKEKAVIVYDTMYGSTKKIAHALANAFIDLGIEVKVYRISTSSISEILAEIVDAKYLLIGSPTMNMDIYPEVSKFLNYLKNLRVGNKISAVFGSYGWREGASDKIKNILKELNFKIVDDECLRVRFTPKDEELNKIIRFVKDIVEQ